MGAARRAQTPANKVSQPSLSSIIIQRAKLPDPPGTDFVIPFVIGAPSAQASHVKKRTEGHRGTRQAQSRGEKVPSPR
jgi:hypothetical protein